MMKDTFVPMVEQQFEMNMLFLEDPMDKEDEQSVHEMARRSMTLNGKAVLGNTK